MPIDLTSNYFELFDLPPGFDIDLDQLASRFRKLQAECHPDQFVNASDEQRRLAVQRTALVNEAADTLKSPRLRARYLLSLKGVNLEDENDLSKDPGYLMQQMELRESIEDAETAHDPLGELDKLREIVMNRRQNIDQDFQRAYVGEAFDDARKAAQKMRFCERIMEEIQRIEERLEEQLL